MTYPQLVMLAASLVAAFMRVFIVPVFANVYAQFHAKLPAATMLLLFLTYPLGLGTYLSFTDAKIGRSGAWDGLYNYRYLGGDTVVRLALFNTVF